MIALNVTDLLICGFSLVNLIYFNDYTNIYQDLFYSSVGPLDLQETKTDYTSFTRHWQILVAFPLTYLGLLSCFITVMLSATRTLAIAKPLHTIRKKFVYIAFSIFTCILLMLFGTKCVGYFHLADQNNSKDRLKEAFEAIGMVEICLVTIMTMVVTISCGISVKTLKNPNEVQSGQTLNDEKSRKAALMIITLSIIFVICNGAWCVMWFVVIAISPQNDTPTESDVWIAMIAMFLNSFLITVNSSVNPIVYILRNSALNQYTRKHFLWLRRGLADGF